MIKRIVLSLYTALVLMFYQNVFAMQDEKGLFFNVQAGGVPTGGPVAIILCLNGTGPLSC